LHLKPQGEGRLCHRMLPARSRIMSRADHSAWAYYETQSTVRSLRRGGRATAGSRLSQSVSAALMALLQLHVYVGPVELAALEPIRGEIV
jgi:hypothetical protein